ALAGLLFIASPMDVVDVFITTDMPLFLFSFASVAFAFRASKTERARDFALAGAMLGLAFLSKYFAVVLGMAEAAFFLVHRPRRWRGLVLLVLCALPFALLNAAWNYSHCWTNVMFNAINRNRDASFSLGTVGVFAGCQLYLATPPVLW